MNKKGFMMAEVVVVSTMILIALATFYVSYGKMIALYNTRLNYYDPVLLYELADYRNDNFKSFSLDSATQIKTINSGGTIYFLKSNNLYNAAANTDLYDKVTNKSYKNYIEYLSNKLVDDTYILVKEKCVANDCKYAYIEVLVK